MKYFIIMTCTIQYNTMVIKHETLVNHKQPQHACEDKTPHLLHLQVLFFDLSDVRLAFAVLRRVKASDKQFSGDKNCRYVQLVRLFQLRKC